MQAIGNVRKTTRLALATMLVASVVATTAATSQVAAAGDFTCTTSTTSEGTLLSWTEVAPDTTYRIRYLLPGIDDFLFNVTHSAGDPAPSAIVPFNYGTYRVINYVNGREDADCVAPAGLTQPPFVCSVGLSDVNWNRIYAEKFSVRLSIAPSFDRFLANTQNTSSPAPSRYGVYSVIARDGGVVDTANCTGPSGAQPPPFECTIAGTGLSWTDQGVPRYWVRRLAGGGSSTFVGSTTERTFSPVVPGADYEVLHRIRGIRFATPCDPPPPEPDECDPVGFLIEFELNDRCGDSAGTENVWEEVLQNLNTGIWTSTVCDGILLTAMPDQVLVSVDIGGDAGRAADEVRRRLAENGIAATTDPDETSQIARIVTVEGALPEDILQLLPLLQGEGFSADLNYLEPVAPNDGFRPFDNPQPAEDPGPAGPAGQGVNILVVDSPGDPSLYDLDGNGLVDEDHGHGEFVASIIRREAPDAQVLLAGVESSAPRLDSGRWAPMMFSDFDIVTTMETAIFLSDLPPFDFINMSLGGAGCLQSSFGFGAGERIALARAMRTLAIPAESTIVAAAGNDGDDVKHFPAAWRDPDATRELAFAVEQEDGAAAQEILELHNFFASGPLIAVGSRETDGSRSGYSNCGDWVNAVAFGSDQIGDYPYSPTGSASWSGTSFSTPNVVAALAGGANKIAYPISGLSC